MNSDLQRVVGTVRDLVICDGAEEFVLTAGQRAGGLGAAAGLAAVGLVGAAVGASSAATSAGDSIQFFSCWLGERFIEGRFSKVTFKEGDELAAIIEPQLGKTVQVLAVTRAKDQTLWMAPHCSRGVFAHRKFAIRMFGWLLLGAPLFVMTSYLILGIWANNLPLEIDGVLFMGAISLGLGSVVALYYPIRFYFQWRPIAQQAERIFVALNYSDPSRVDLPRYHERFCKMHSIPWPYLSDGPWIYRYLDSRET